MCERDPPFFVTLTILSVDQFMFNFGTWDSQAPVLDARLHALLVSSLRPAGSSLTLSSSATAVAASESFASVYEPATGLLCTCASDCASLASGFVMADPPEWHHYEVSQHQHQQQQQHQHQHQQQQEDQNWCQDTYRPQEQTSRSLLSKRQEKAAAPCQTPAQAFLTSGDGDGHGNGEQLMKPVRWPARTVDATDTRSERSEVEANEKKANLKEEEKKEAEVEDGQGDADDDADDDDDDDDDVGDDADEEAARETRIVRLREGKSRGLRRRSPKPAGDEEGQRSPGFSRGRIVACLQRFTQWSPNTEKQLHRSTYVRQTRIISRVRHEANHHCNIYEEKLGFEESLIS
ncbi:unnamed protein product [Protopolystoma xenopodis]|uniref:Uncharacterized protein n=1 Tax=Protopolystoma xenopodis TaxID=117903 RepID=A0A3S5CVV0_9PLAT|nr:unnamed protein product [Protopolystoma xenopodis]